MAKLGINTGTTPNDGTGDSLFVGVIKINSNFTEIYNKLGDGTNLTAIGGTWATTSVGIHTIKNVGIGTTNPTSKLTVGGNVKISGVVTATAFYGDGSHLTGIGSGGGGGDSYWTQNDSGIYTESNVGIGTTVIVSKLTIQGNSPIVYNQNKWVATYGDIGIGNSYPITGSVATDDLGNIYLAGSYYPYNDIGSAIISKFDSSGNILWQYNLNGPGSYNNSARGTNIQVDTNYNVYVTIQFTSYDVGSVTIFAKLDSSGNIIWQKELDDSSYFTSDVSSIGIGSTGSVYTTGWRIESGDTKVLLVKYDNDGNLQFQKTFSASSNDYGLAIGIGTISDNIYVSGYTQENSGVGFISKYDSSGAIVWQNRIDLSSYGYGSDALVLDSSENVYVLSSTTDEGSGNYDIHIAKFDTDGNLIWQNVFGGTSDDYIYGGAACDSLDNIYVCGITYSSGAGYSNLVIFKFDSSGNIVWQRTLGTSSDYTDEWGNSSDDCIKVEGDKIIVTGYTNYNSGIVLASLSTDGDFIGKYGIYEIKDSNLTSLTSYATITPLDFVEGATTLTENSGTSTLSNLNYSTNITYSYLSGGHALDTDGYLKVNSINPYEKDGNLGVGVTNPQTKLEINGVLGFTGHYTYCGNRNNILIGDSTTGANLNPDSYLGRSNIFLGIGAGQYTTTGYYNNFFGLYSGRCNTTGTSNNFLGFYSGHCNTTGCYNNFFGCASGYYNTCGSYNNFFGYVSGCNNTTGNNNIAIGGKYAGYCNTTGSYNISFGDYTYGATTGSGNFLGGYAAGYAGMNDSSYNNFIGWYSGGKGDQGSSYCNNFLGYYAGSCSCNSYGNNFFGPFAGSYNSSGSYNNFFGYGAGNYNSGCYNNFFGYRAGQNNFTGSYNNFLGFIAGCCNTTGYSNNFIGNQAGYKNNTGYYNNFFGYFSGSCNTSGSYNNFFGRLSGAWNQTGNHNLYLGNSTGISTSNSYKILLGTGTFLNTTYRFDAPNPNKNKQFAVGLNTTGTAEYWLVGDENLNVGIGTTLPTSKLSVGGAILATDGFISDPNNIPIKITLVDNQLTFSAVGIGSTTLILS